ncbi:MAG: hypothetical protein Q8Q29_09890 [Actinomycetota bacterium]|nr:hypothetical protein [Actinomycetota bacterium]
MRIVFPAAMEPEDDTAAEPPGRSRWSWPIVGLAALPLFVWWVSWYPGMLSGDSLHQLAAVESGDFTNEVPAIHSIIIWLVTRVWDSPAAVSLVQVAAMVALLASYLRRARGAGIPGWLAGAAVLAFAWLPAVGATTIAVEVQVSQTLVGIWLLVELLGLAPDPNAYLSDPWSAARLGVALGATWLFDHAGMVVVLVMLAALAAGLRSRTHLLAVPAGGAIALFLLVQGPLYFAFGVDRGVPPLGEAYAPEIAAVYRHQPGWFEEADLELMRAVADLEVWQEAYRCGDGASLLTDREFDTAAIRAHAGAYRGLLVRSALTHPMTVAGHRACAVGVLFAPFQPAGERFETYVYNVPPNDLGIERDSLWPSGFSFTKAILVRSNQPALLWLFWRPGIILWPALAGIVTLTIRRRCLLWPAAVLIGFLLMAVLTVREPSFRESFSVYSLSFLSLPLWWPALSRDAAE